MENTLNVMRLVRRADSSVFIFEDGEIAYLPQIQYSPDGVFNWENKFVPITHMSEANPKLTIEGHTYIRFRLNPTEEWSMPAKIVGKDGKSPTFFVVDKQLLVKFEGELPSVIFDLNKVKGDQGIQGQPGVGLHIDRVMFWDEMMAANPEAASSNAGGQGCTSCAPTTTCSGDHVKLVLCLGDNRRHLIQPADWALPQQYHKVNASDTEWVPTTGLHFNLAVEQYGYNGNDIATVNNAYEENTLGKANKVYARVNGIWKEMLNLSTPDYRLAPSNSDPTSARYAADYVNLSTTITLSSNVVFEVRNNSLEMRHINPDAIGFGLSIFEGLILKVNSADLAGFGLAAYTNADGELALQVLPVNAAGDGIAIESTEVDEDGAMQWKIRVVAEHLQSVIDDNTPKGGAIGTAEATADGFKNFIWLPEFPLSIDANKAIVFCDEKTATTLLTFGEVRDIDGNVTTPGIRKIALKPTDNGELGVQALHIHKNVFDELKGLAKPNPTEPAFILLDPAYFEFKQFAEGANTYGRISMKDGVVLGRNLNEDAFNKALELVEILTPTKEGGTVGTGEYVVNVRYDATQFGVDGNNRLVIIRVPVAALPDGIVLTLNDMSGNQATKNITLVGAVDNADKTVTTQYFNLDVAIPTSDGAEGIPIEERTVVIKLTVLKALTDKLAQATADAYNWKTLVAGANNVTGVAQATTADAQFKTIMDILDKCVKLDTAYGNTMIKSGTYLDGGGLMLNTDGSSNLGVLNGGGRVIVDNNRNLDVEI